MVNDMKKKERLKYIRIVLLFLIFIFGCVFSVDVYGK